MYNAGPDKNDIVSERKQQLSVTYLSESFKFFSLLHFPTFQLGPQWDQRVVKMPNKLKLQN
jgi:hypothetical protein